MKTSLEHPPQTKQCELAHFVRILFEEFEAAHALGTHKWKKQDRIAKLVLSGSYARGDWVDVPVEGYTSDYDFLIVVNDERSDVAHSKEFSGLIIAAVRRAHHTLE